MAAVVVMLVFTLDIVVTAVVTVFELVLVLVLTVVCSHYEVCESYVFTPVCLSTGRSLLHGGCLLRGVPGPGVCVEIPQ